MLPFQLVVTATDANGKEIGKATLKVEPAASGRWWAHEAGPDVKPWPLGDGYFLIGFDFRPYTERKDTRPPKEIERTNMPKVKRPVPPPEEKPPVTVGRR